MTALIWFRSDLRIDDNAALHNALRQTRRAAAVFYATPEQWRTHDMAAAKGEFLWRNLACLRDSLARMAIALHVRVVPRYLDINADLLTLCEELRCSAVFANREYGINELRRDEAIAAGLTAKNIDWHCFDDATLLAPGTVRTQQGQPFKIFTPFRRALINLIGDEPVPAFASQPTSISNDRDISSSCPPLPPYPYERSALPEALWPAGEASAAQRLAHFIDGPIENYKNARDFPGMSATSQLSPYLALGVISIRRCVEAALAVNKGRWQDGSEGVVAWLNELIWREFYLHVLAQFPRVSMNRPLRADTEYVQWRSDRRDFEAWCAGRTGYPLVDAAMRQLVQTGWMHNRLRMVSAMFLCKYLLIDWRWGERFFMQHLVDGDLAANNGGWQWSASTGTDAAPYFRLLSPIKQMERFDAEARFCKSYLPELAALDAAVLRQPGHPELLRAGYPAPIVDLKFARGRALQAFSATSATSATTRGVSA